MARVGDGRAGRQGRGRQVRSLRRHILLDSDAAAWLDASIRRQRQSARLLRIGLKPSEEADRALLRRTTISIAQPFEGPKDVTASVRQQQPAAAPTASIRGCLHQNAVAPDRSALSLLHLAEQAPAEVVGALSQLVHLISLAERRPRACSVENAEVGLEHDQREVDSCIAWLSERLASGPTLTAQIRPERAPDRRPRWLRSQKQSARPSSFWRGPAVAALARQDLGATLSQAVAEAAHE